MKKAANEWYFININIIILERINIIILF
jgi:hypothetical protein